jgi:hypothetical protein
LVARGAELLIREREGASELSGIGAWTYRGDAALQHFKTVEQRLLAGENLSSRKRKREPLRAIDFRNG